MEKLKTLKVTFKFIGVFTALIAIITLILVTTPSSIAGN